LGRDGRVHHAADDIERELRMALSRRFGFAGGRALLGVKLVFAGQPGKNPRMNDDRTTGQP
jgi:hypothetical protein